MNQEAYAFIEKNEDFHWWFNARQNIIKTFLNKERPFFENVLDVGCGTGFFLKNITEISKNRYGIDSHNYSTNNIKVIKGDALNIPFEDNSMDLVTMLDVLEHIPEADKALKELHRVVKKDGIGFITVPAIQMLYSPHDKNHGHVKRYYKKDLKDLLEENGFEVVRISYFNTILFPIEFAIRMIEKVLDKEFEKKENKDNIINKLLYYIFNLETYLLNSINLPIGLSLAAIVKPIQK